MRPHNINFSFVQPQIITCDRMLQLELKIQFRHGSRWFVNANLQKVSTLTEYDY